MKRYMFTSQKLGFSDDHPRFVCFSKLGRSNGCSMPFYDQDMFRELALDGTMR